MYVNKHVFLRHALKHVSYGMSSSKFSHVISSNMFSHGMPISMFSHDMFTVGRAPDSKVRGPGFHTRSGHILSFLLPLIQEGQLSVTGESMCKKYWLTAWEKCG